MVGNEWRKAIGKLPCLSLRIPQMLRLLDHGFDAAVNSRYVVGGSEDRSGEWGAMQEIPLRGDYGKYFVDFIFRSLRKICKVCELPYKAMPRRSRESKTGTNLLQFLRRGRK